jgi:hypothetical protein
MLLTSTEGMVTAGNTATHPHLNQSHANSRGELFRPCRIRELRPGVPPRSGRLQIVISLGMEFISQDFSLVGEASALLQGSIDDRQPVAPQPKSHKKSG